MIYLVAGMGRCGTTLVWDAIHATLGLPKEFLVRVDPAQLRDQCVYKTHDHPPASLPESKVIYLFGNPMDIVCSVHETTGWAPDYLSAHYYNLHGDFDRRDKYVTEDTLHLQANFDAWMRPQGFPLLAVKYEKMFENLDAIDRFLGFKVNWPKPVPRRTNWLNHPQVVQLAATYNLLNFKVRTSPDVCIWV